MKAGVEQIILGGLAIYLVFRLAMVILWAKDRRGVKLEGKDLAWRRGSTRVLVVATPVLLPIFAALYHEPRRPWADAWWLAFLTVAALWVVRWLLPVWIRISRWVRDGFRCGE